MYLRGFLIFLLVFALNGNAVSQSVGITPVITGAENFRGGTRPLFPAALFTQDLAARDAREAARPFWVPTEEEAAHSPYHQSILLNNLILAFYGHPLSRYMGIIGRYSKEELLRQLTVLAEEYKAISGKNVIKAFYLIYGTVWPAGEIGIIRESVLREWIQFTLENNMLIFLDHQIGRFDPHDSLRRMFPYLKYPHVHLALDPEWRTDRPMEVIGHLTAAEINQAQRVMEDFMIENNIPGERMLVIHQFNHIMIRNRPDVRADFAQVRLVHCISGIGSPAMKKATYEFGARATNMPVKGFKLWFDFGIPGHTDIPLMTPAQVMGLNPRPYVIMYQ